MNTRKPHRLLIAIAACTLFHAGTCAAAAPALDEQAIAQLLESGWQIDHAEDGSLLLYPPSDTIEETLAADPPASTRASFSIIDDQTLDELRSHGWQVDIAPDQSVLLYPPARPDVGTVADAPEAIAESPSGPSPEIQSDETPSSGPGGTPPPVSEPVAEDQTAAPALSEEALFEALESHGWTVDKAPDGSLLLFPRGYEPSPVEPAAPTPLPGTCSGHLPVSVADGSIELPVDSWKEAYAIAADWLTDSGIEGLDVGRVRHLFQVHIVSIVEARAPHKLHHQIAIRRSDGRILLLE